MDYQIALSPDLEITPEEFAAAWNEAAAKRAISEARLAQAKGVQYEPITLTLILFTVGTGVAVNVLSDLIKDTVQRLRDKKGAQKAAASIATYGEMLFNAVFKDPDVYSEYRDMLRAGLSGVQIEIEGTPKFHALHWEAFKDPKFPQPLALQATMVRKNRQKQNLPLSVRPSPIINLLIVVARPSGKRDVGYRTISRPLVESLGSANLRVQVEILRPGTYRALENHLREVTAKHGEGYYHVIHFDVHGAVLTYEEYQQIQKEPTNNPYQYKPYARKAIAPYEGVKAFLAFEPEADEEDKEKQSDLVEASDL